MRSLSRLPTDIQILDQIWKSYREEFSSGKERRLTPNYIPINVDQVAKSLLADGDIVYTRLYYTLDNKYRYQQEDGSLVHFFAFEIRKGDKKERHCINFPYMAAVLADIRQERFRYRWIMILSILSFAVAFAAAVVSLFSVLGSS